MIKCQKCGKKIKRTEKANVYYEKPGSVAEGPLTVCMKCLLEFLGK